MSNILRLRPASTDEQVQALAGLFDEELATKSDLERLRIATKADINALKVELKAEVEKSWLEVQRDLKTLESGILNRMLALSIDQGIAVVSLIVTLEKMLR